MKFHRFTTPLPLCIAVGLIGFVDPSAQAEVPTAAQIRDARALHGNMVTLDTHLDTPAVLARPGWDILQRHDARSGFSQVDYPRMLEGGLSGGFFAIYTEQGPLTAQGYAHARDAALLRATRIGEMVAAHGDRFALATSAADAQRIQAAGKRIVFESIENSYPLGEDLTLLDTFYALGVRLAGPVHYANNQFADSATDKKGATWHGLSPLGKQFVGAANRLGIVLDASHASDEVLDQLIVLSKVPVILSHSGCKAVFDHPRNIDDARLRALAASGGVIQINSLSDYMIATPANPARLAALGAVYATLEDPQQLTQAREAEAAAKLADINKQYPVPRATFDDFMRHLLHALQVAGRDHVGIGLDFDGGGGVTGLEDVADIPKISAALLQAGYSAADLRQIWGGNVLRVLGQAEAYAAAQRKPQHP